MLGHEESSASAKPNNNVAHRGELGASGGIESTTNVVGSKSSLSSNRVIWFEIAAVLAIGVVPHQIAALDDLTRTSTNGLQYWLYALKIIGLSVCISVAVLYIIHASGQPWSYFGLGRIRWRDLALAFPLWLADWVMWLCVAPVLPSYPGEFSAPRVGPAGGNEYLLTIAMDVANGFAEELVCRAYLITRLLQVLNSRITAVVFSAALFASYHIYYGPGAALYFTFLLGLFLGTVFLVIRRVWPLAIAHALINISIVFVRQ